MRKLIIFPMLLLTGCMGYAKQGFTGYDVDGKKLTLGMTAAQVRKIAGEPTTIVLPNAETLAVASDNVYEPMIEGEQYWHYGSLKKGDKDQLDITFSKGVVTKIWKISRTP